MQFSLRSLLKFATWSGIVFYVLSDDVVRWRSTGRAGDVVVPLVVQGFFVLVLWVIWRRMSYLAAYRPNDWWATGGMIVGIFIGYVQGRTTALGRWAVDTFNPDLVRWEWEPLFGTIVGMVIGAFIGALIGGFSGIIYHWWTGRTFNWPAASNGLLAVGVLILAVVNCLVLLRATSQSHRMEHQSLRIKDLEKKLGQPGVARPIRSENEGLTNSSLAGKN